MPYTRQIPIHADLMQTLDLCLQAVEIAGRACHVLLQHQFTATHVVLTFEDSACRRVTTGIAGTAAAQPASASTRKKATRRPATR
jgi:hypothetical protein